MAKDVWDGCTFVSMNLDLEEVKLMARLLDRMSLNDLRERGFTEEEIDRIGTLTLEFTR